MTARYGLVVLLLLMPCAGSIFGQPSPQAQPSTPAGPPPVQGGTADSPWPDGSDRWLFNAEERTQAGRDALEGADADRAVERFDTALRLQPDDPVAEFNAGTARLTDKRPGARELLEAAAREAPERLKAPASYNLGNALLEAGSLPDAIKAYEDALRADPGFGDAKHNLEVALRRLQQQQQNQDQNQDKNQDQQEQDQEQDQKNQGDQQDQQDQNDQQKQDQQDKQDQGQKDQQEEDQPDQQDQQQQDQQEQQKQEGEDEKQPPGGAGQNGENSPLPQFQDLPDMSAEEAAAILEAIENMERQNRREQALEAAKKAQASGKKDW